MTRSDLVMLGGGSAAFAAALKATELGAEVAICEEWVSGGTCLNRGCIPSKNLLRVSEVFYYSRHQPFKGIENVDYMTSTTALDLRRLPYPCP